MSPNLGSVRIYSPIKDKNTPIKRSIEISSFNNNAPVNITIILPPNNIKAPTPVLIVKYAKLKPTRYPTNANELIIELILNLGIFF